MKITPEHYEHLKTSIAAIWSPEKHADHLKFIVNEGRARDAEKRLRHDWMYYAGLSAWVCDNLYSYMDDTHLDTALKSVVRDLCENC